MRESAARKPAIAFWIASRSMTAGRRSVRESAAHQTCDCLLSHRILLFSGKHFVMDTACEGQKRNCQCYVQHVYYFLLTSVEN